MGSALIKNNVNIIGSGKQTLVFGHGFGTDQTAWKAMLPFFIEDYRIVLYDNIAAGQADPDSYSPNKYNSLHAYAQDLNEICESLGLKDAVYIGHSVSGMIGMLASIAEPRYFKKMVFIGASPRYLNDTGYVGGFEQSDLNGLYESMTNNYYAWVNGFAPLAMGNPDKPELAADFARTLSSLRPDVALAVAKNIFQSDHRADLPKMDKETLILQSSNDIAVPMEVGLYLNQHIKESKLININSTGHLPHISAPGEAGRAILGFLN
jgi:sigma-B regulation protein RsbQ